MNLFTVQGKAIPSSVREKIIESWLERKGPTQIGKELRLQKQTIANIVDNFVRRGNSEAEQGGNNTRLARTDDVNVYIEYCKKSKPSIYSSEIQNKSQLVEDNQCVCLKMQSTIWAILIRKLTLFRKNHEHLKMKTDCLNT